MKPRCTRFGILMPALFLAGASAGCTPGKPAPAPASASTQGEQCPVCPVCPAPADQETGPQPKASSGPEVSVLYHLTDLYAPVRFQHQQHTNYADSCTVCHHHHSEIETTPACRECHGQPFKTLARPGLKGAYHRQCMNCHRELGAGPLECEECHQKRKSASPPPKEVPEGVANIITLGHIAKELGPVRFDHSIHMHMADSCQDCHHHAGEVEATPPCRECHNTRATAPGEKKLGLKDAYHKECLGCHKGMGGPQKCEQCHAAKAVVKKK